MNNSMEQFALGRNVKYLREQRGWTQSALAQMLGFESQGYISEIERGTANLKFSTLMKLASIFGVSTKSLMFADMETHAKAEQYFTNPAYIRRAKYYKDAGTDLILPHKITLPRGGVVTVRIPTGFTPPEGTFPFITTRGSGNLMNIHVDGIVDPTYSDHLQLTIKNGSPWRRQIFEAGTAIAQVIFLYYSNPLSEDLNLPHRGANKHGSTGK